MADCSLTVGMATYDDAFGVWTTVSAIREHHPDVPIVVVDTKPGGCRRTRGSVLAAGGRYLHRPDLSGTAAPRDAVFRLSRTPWTMCVDSHVIMRAGAVATAIQYAEDHPNSKDILQGPLLGDDGSVTGTHWRSTTVPGIWGVWDVDGGAMKQRAPFDIPAQGLGQFMMRRAAWPGFHPLHRGFGGEEGYIQHKVRHNGGRALCHPGLGWRHFFRDMENGAPPPPYPLRTEDHAWNLLVDHRELGIEAEDAIFKDFGRNIPQAWPKLVSEARQAQPFGKRLPERPRLRILGIWYSNNAAPPCLMAKSLETIRIAKESTTRHDVAVTTCSWGPVGGNPFPWVAAKRTAPPGHATILEQQRQCVAITDGFDWQVVCFLEHDTLYPSDYFDRIGNAFTGHGHVVMPDVVSNLDYEGLNQTGWLSVKERHEPLHQIALRRPFAEWNFQRCQDDCDKQGWCYLEPQTDRRHWVRIQPSAGQRITMPSIHVNFDGRFTTHGEVCYDPVATSIIHPHWGKFEQYWPGKPAPVAVASCGSCGAAAATAQYQTPADWFAAVAKPEVAADCWEHLGTVRDLAAKCEHVTELNIWGSPWLAAILAGGPKEIVSVGGGPMPNWATATAICQRQQKVQRTTKGGQSAVDFDGTLTSGWVPPADDYMVITGRLERERQHVDAVAGNRKIFFREDHVPATNHDVASHKAAAISKHSVVEYWEDNAEQAAIIRKLCPTVVVHHVAGSPASEVSRLSTLINDSAAAELGETDMLLTDTIHTGAQLLRELTAHASKVRRFIVIHDTAIFGDVGDDGSPGLLHGVRHWVRRNPEWSVIRHDDNNYGLTVLSRSAEDKPTVEAGAWKKLGTFVTAMAKHVAGGLETAEMAVVEQRLDICAMCPLRVGLQCSKCGCELETNPLGGPGKAFLPAEQCPVGKW